MGSPQLSQLPDGFALDNQKDEEKTKLPDGFNIDSPTPVTTTNSRETVAPGALIPILDQPVPDMVKNYQPPKTPAPVTDLPEGFKIESQITKPTASWEPESKRILSKYSDPLMEKNIPTDERMALALDESFKKGLYGHKPIPAVEAEMRKHPVVAALGEGAGNLIGLMGVGTGVEPLMAQAAKASIAKHGLSLIPAITTAANIGKAGSTFGLKTALDKISKVVQGDQLTMKDVGDTLKSTATGGIFGAAGSVANPISRLTAQGLVGYGTAKIDGADDLNATINGAVNVLFGVTHHTDMGIEFKQKAINHLQESLSSKLTQVNNITAAQGKAQANDFIYSSAVKATGINDPKLAMDKVLQDPHNSLDYFEALDNHIKNFKAGDKLPGQSEPIAGSASAEGKTAPSSIPKPANIVEAEKHGTVIGIDAGTKLPIIDTSKPAPQPASPAPQEPDSPPAIPLEKSGNEVLDKYVKGHQYHSITGLNNWLHVNHGDIEQDGPEYKQIVKDFIAIKPEAVDDFIKSRLLDREQYIQSQKDYLKSAEAKKDPNIAKRVNAEIKDTLSVTPEQFSQIVMRDPAGFITSPEANNYDWAKLVKPSVTVETDPARVQEIKNSIQEGELILQSGKKVDGTKYTPEELDAIQRSVDNSKRKIGMEVPNVNKVNSQTPEEVKVTKSPDSQGAVEVVGPDAPGKGADGKQQGVVQKGKITIVQPDKFFIRINDEATKVPGVVNGFKEAEGAKAISFPGHAGHEFFISRPPSGKGWIASEAKTGLRFADGKTQKEAADNAISNLKEATKKIPLQQAIDAGIEKRGLSPRYTRAGKTQKEAVKAAVADGPKHVKDVAKETGILEPNIRRILGVGAKEGTFERVDTGVYILKNNGRDVAYVIPGDSVETLPRLAKEGFKADMVFLDIPYKTPALAYGGKARGRPMAYEFITPDQFKVVLDAVKTIAKTPDSPVIYMYSQAKSGQAAMQEYTDAVLDAGFKPVARGEYTKLQKDGLTQVRNMRGEVMAPEGIIVFNQSGKFEPKADGDFNFKLVRPKGYQTEKPAEMLAKMISMTTDEGDVVLDPFAGSGVTIDEAKKSGRVGVGIEKSTDAIEKHIKPRLEKSDFDTALAQFPKDLIALDLVGQHKTVEDLKYAAEHELDLYAEGEESDIKNAQDVLRVKKFIKFADKLSADKVSTPEQAEKVIGDMMAKENITVKDDYLIYAKPAASPQEFEARIDQLNKFAQAHAILRKASKSSKWAGLFTGKGKRGEIKIEQQTFATGEGYVATLAHELGHALEHNVLGRTNRGLKLFGTLDHATTKKVYEELIAVTKDVAGEAVVKAKPEYYLKPAELIARFFEKMISSPGNLEELAPTAVALIEQQALKYPMIEEFLQAARLGIDKGAPKFVPLRDLKETYQKYLGKRVGNIAYGEEIAYRAMKERAKYVLGNFVEEKFKGIKDAPETLFRAAEAIKISRGGVPEFGTRSYTVPHSAEEEEHLIKMGWEKMPRVVIENGITYPLYGLYRYTPEQAKTIFDSLSPAGKKLILDFTAERQEAKDYFNREMISEENKVERTIEGWVHHYFEDEDGGLVGGPSTVQGGKRFKERLAGTRRHRTGALGYVEDFKKAMTKALIDLEGERVYNDFIKRQFARVTRPLPEGQKPMKGWVEVIGDTNSGAGMRGEKTVTIVDQETGKSMKPKYSRYQMPAPIYERYKLWKGLVEEASTATKIVNDINRYWRINILAHPGTAATNFISGGVQYSAKILTDFYTEVLTGNAKMPQTRRNISAMVKVLLPKGWRNAPDWVYGSDLSNFYGQFMKQKSIGGQAIDTYANGALKLFGAVEQYWKKVIITAENVGDLGRLTAMSPEGLKLPTDAERDILAMINEEVDLYAYDYDNVPVWLEAHQKSVLGQAIKPFAKWPYKYAKQVMDMVGSAFDQTQPWQTRMAKIMALATMVGVYGYYSSQRKKAQKTPQVDPNLNSVPARLQTRGRLFLTTDENGKEVFMRTSKYPFIGLTEAGMQMVNGNFEGGKDALSDMLGSIGPMGTMGLAAFSYTNKYQQYTPVPVLLGQTLASFMPASRILNDVSRMLDPYQRKQETFGQAFGQLVPTTDRDLQDKLHGKVRTEKVPVEADVKAPAGQEGNRTTFDLALENHWQDIGLSLLSGIYLSRIDPKIVQAYIERAQKNQAKREEKELKNKK